VEKINPVEDPVFNKDKILCMMMSIFAPDGIEEVELKLNIRLKYVVLVLS
jgi:hypothetical protein